MNYRSGISTFTNADISASLPLQSAHVWRQTSEPEQYGARWVGHKKYEMKDHLGNVRMLISDKRLPANNADILGYTNYYPFGSIQPGRDYNASKYRFGFNGKEMDNEVKGTGVQYDYGFRIYDARIGKFLSVDPLTSSYPWYTPYQFAGNKPIQCLDLDGLEEYSFIFYNGDKVKGQNAIKINDHNNIVLLGYKVDYSKPLSVKAKWGPSLDQPYLWEDYSFESARAKPKNWVQKALDPDAMVGGKAPLVPRLVASMNPLISGANILTIVFSEDNSNIYQEKPTIKEGTNNLLDLAGEVAAFHSKELIPGWTGIVIDLTTTTVDWVDSKVTEKTPISTIKNGTKMEIYKQTGNMPKYEQPSETQPSDATRVVL